MTHDSSGHSIVANVLESDAMEIDDSDLLMECQLFEYYSNPQLDLIDQFVNDFTQVSYFFLAVLELGSVCVAKNFVSAPDLSQPRILFVEVCAVVLDVSVGIASEPRALYFYAILFIWALHFFISLHF